MDFETARHNMVESQIRCCKILDPALLDAFESMPREEFLPEDVKTLAYMDGHVPLPAGQEMLTPLQDANVMQALGLTGDERVLEIGAGTGYLTALMAMHAKEVVAFELHEELAELARRNLEQHGVTNATVIHGNGMLEDSLKGQGKFDAIVLEAAVKEVPDFFFEHLNPGGRLVAFIGENPVVKLVSMRRAGNGQLETREWMETLLSGMEGLPRKREFVF